MAGSEARYRADIDGLRAVAVLPVVLYHFGVPGFDGGFVGVDVFFVISGYLITGIVAGELRQDRFSFAHFYERRARRLFPTLAIVLAATFAAALYVMTPQDFAVFSRSMLYALVFAANFFFDSQGGYFGPNLELSPLLHTWSLSVEEQFYIVWPLFLWLAFRHLPKRGVAILVGILLLASLYANLSLTETKPIAAFYRPHARAWELLVGCMLALAAPPVRGVAAPTIRAIVAHLMGMAGLCLILFAVFTFSSETPFPGVAVIAPVLGTALVIWSGQSSTITKRALSLPPFVFIGLVSYAWYLWHWPMVSLFRYHFERDPAAPEIAALLAVSFVLAVLCWKFVEMPVRRGAGWKPRPRALKAAVGAATVLMTLAITGHVTRGFLDRYPESIRELSRAQLSDPVGSSQCLPEAPGTDPGNVICRLAEGSSPGAPGILLWGDSHARELRTVLRNIGRSAGVSVSHAGVVACPPLIGVGRARSGKDRCAAANAAVGDVIARQSFSDVVLVARWIGYSDKQRAHTPRYLRDAATTVPSMEENRLVMARALRRTVELIRSRGARVWVLIEPPAVGFDVPNRLARAIMRGDHPQTVYGIDAVAGRSRSAFMRELVANLPVHVLEAADSLCDAVRCFAVANGKPLYFDDNHLSVYGTARLEPLLRTVVSPAAAGPLPPQGSKNATSIGTAR